MVAEKCFQSRWGAAVVLTVLLCGPQSISANFDPVLDPIPHLKVKEGELVTISLSAYDLDGDSVALSAANLPPGALFDDTAGFLTWTPTYLQSGLYDNIQFEARDGRGGLGIRNIHIQVVHWPPGDVSSNGTVTSADLIFLVNFIFRGGTPPIPTEAGDFNGDGPVNSSDIIRGVAYVFRGGGPPFALPEIKINYPIQGSVLSDQHWLSVENMNGRIPPGQLDLNYSSDGVNFQPLYYDSVSNPFYIFDTTDVNGLWDTRSLPSGVYHLQAILNAPPYSSQDEISVLVNRPPQPRVNISHTPGSDSVTLFAQATTDPENDTLLKYLWHFLCDSSTVEGMTVTHVFQRPESCLVALEVRDIHQNVGVTHGVLHYMPPLISYQDEVYNCQCESINIIAMGEIPKNGGIYDTEKTSKLSYPDEKKHPSGGKKLGPLDHTTPLKGGGTQKAHVALYFMVEAKVSGNAQKCSTLQLVNGTIKFNGTSGQPSEKHYFHPTEKKSYPFKESPAKTELGFKAAYTTACGEGSKDFIEKKDRIIRWICTPGIHVSEEKDDYQNISQSANFDKLFQPNGLEFNMFFWVEVIDNLAETGCVTGACKKCFIFGFKYDKDKNAQDVTGDGQPDMPTIIKYVTCP